MNPITTYFLVKEAGWRRIARREMVKNAIDIRKLLGGARKAVPSAATYGGLALGAGAMGHSIMKDRQIEGLEARRELVGAMNDTVVRQRIGDIYRMAGYPEPAMPLAVSQAVSPEYKRVLMEMSSAHAE